jgi:hypothetical protein
MLDLLVSTLMMNMQAMDCIHATFIRRKEVGHSVYKLGTVGSLTGA